MRLMSQAQLQFKLKKQRSQFVLNEIQRLENLLGRNRFLVILAKFRQNIVGNLQLIPQELYLQILSSIDEWNLLSLKINREKTSMLKQISHINFRDLISLKLYNTEINNIEPFSWLMAPSLVQIELQGNHITSLKPLAKLQRLSLIKLTLYGNFFNHNQIQYLNRVKAPNLEILRISWKIRFIQIFTTIDIVNPLLKTQTKQVFNTIVISDMITDPLKNQFQSKLFHPFALKNTNNHFDLVNFRRSLQEEQQEQQDQ